jgi:Putative peptidoglycan binding domain/N-acetylmuramoyl-L-alanine amidase
MKVINRADWTSRIPRNEKVDLQDEVDGLPNFVKSEVAGVAIHYTGMKTTANNDPLDLLRSVMSHDMDVKRISDIMYNLAVTPSGDVVVCRGLINRGGANSATDPQMNRKYVSILVLVGVDDKITKDMIKGIQFARTCSLYLYPEGTEVVGHRDIRATACPGEALQKLVDNGTLATDYSPDTVVSSNPAPTLTLGNRNSRVFDLQNILVLFGFNQSPVDGYYGPNTQAAVASFQTMLKGANLYPYTIDGVYGPKTAEGLAKLQEILSHL